VDGIVSVFILRKYENTVFYESCSVRLTIRPKFFANCKTINTSPKLVTLHDAVSSLVASL